MKRNNIIRVRVSNDELEELMEAKQGRTLSDVIRKRLLS